MIQVHTRIPFSEALCSQRTHCVADVLIDKFQEAGIHITPINKPSVIALAHYVGEKTNLTMETLKDLSIDDMEWGAITAIEKNMSIADFAIVCVRKLQKIKHPNIVSRLRNTNSALFPKLHAFNVEHMKTEFESIFGRQKNSNISTYWAQEYIKTFNQTPAPELRSECSRIYQLMVDDFYHKQQQTPDRKLIYSEEQIYWCWYWHFQFPIPDFVQGVNADYPRFADYSANNIVIDTHNTMDMIGKCLGILQLPARKSGGREELLIQMLSHLDDIAFNIQELGHLSLYYALKKEPHYKDVADSWIQSQSSDPQVMKFQTLEHIAPVHENSITQALWIHRMLDNTNPLGSLELSLDDAIDP